MNITNSSGVTSGTLQLTGSLSNVTPIINGGVSLPAINNNTATSGVIATITGTNGSSDTGNNTLQLQWSITAGNSGGYFSIDANTGVISQSGAAANTYNLTIRLTDANGGTGALFAESIQQVVVASTTVGFPFYAGNQQGNIPQACPINGAQDSSCGNNLYYNRTTSSGTPLVNDIIAVGPAQNSPLAGGGYYTYNCGYGTGTGTDRLYFQIEHGGTGKVIAVTNCPS